MTTDSNKDQSKSDPEKGDTPKADGKPDAKSRPRQTTKGSSRRSRVTMRNLKLEDFETLRSAMEITYRGSGLDPWGYDQIKRLL